MNESKRAFFITLFILIGVAIMIFVVVRDGRNAIAMDQKRELREETCAYEGWVKLTSRKDITFNEWKYLRKYNCLNSTMKSIEKTPKEAEQ